MAALIFTDHRFLGVRVGRLYVQIKDVRLHPAYFSERYKKGCRHVTAGNWRVVLRWRP